MHRASAAPTRDFPSAWCPTRGRFPPPPGCAPTWICLRAEDAPPAILWRPPHWKLQPRSSNGKTPPALATAWRRLPAGGLDLFLDSGVGFVRVLAQAAAFD